MFVCVIYVCKKMYLLIFFTSMIQYNLILRDFPNSLYLYNYLYLLQTSLIFSNFLHGRRRPKLKSLDSVFFCCSLLI